ncbi:BamA/TamA family outer membrane protein [Shewanella sp. KX20019]|uniref:BamA/TamA family outer membrane protein n=1 Tax=Shewanella sp. KX20019 TaxID=2803864 RepID=UPI0019280602|nr:BamA/TamA family outer membrane protein [Shewanella sp. KX20019]QQX80553.1 BamA/TamA family outer membrane protein [Shewanella sp. KX20019]
MRITKLNTLACSLAAAVISPAYSNEVSNTSANTEVVQEVVINSDRTNKFKPIILPFYDPSIKAGISAIPLFAFYPDENDLVSDASTIAIPLIYTSNDSYIAKVAGDIILFEDNFRLSFETGFTSTNQPLSGIDSNKETIEFDADFMFKVASDFYLGVGGIYTSTRYTADNPEQQSALEDFGFTGDYQDDIGYRVSMQWDTREHFYYPHSGFIWDLQYENHAEWLGNDTDKTYSSVFTDFRHFYSIGDNSNRIIATKFVARYLIDAENAPSSAFTTYGRQGKEVQRGYAIGDYISSNMVNLEVEYRHKFSATGNDYLDKSAVVLIGGVGKSFGEQLQGNTQDFRDSDLLGVIGVGFRYNILPYERLNIKVDLTYNSDGDTIVYFGFGESI